MLFYLNIPKERFLVVSDKGKTDTVSPVFACELLLAHSNFVYLRMFPDVDHYLYDQSSGIYVKVSHDTLMPLTRKILRLFQRYEPSFQRYEPVMNTFVKLLIIY
nr:putative phage/plasmid DNA primase [Oedogonium sp. 269]